MAKGPERPTTRTVTGPKQRSRRTPAVIVVTDDWPDDVPITIQEVRVIETHLSSVLDELLGPLP